MSIFRLKPDPVVGIDIGSTAVKLLELSKIGDQLQVESYAMEPLPENSVEDKDIMKRKEIMIAINVIPSVSEESRTSELEILRSFRDL